MLLVQVKDYPQTVFITHIFPEHILFLSTHRTEILVVGTAYEMLFIDALSIVLVRISGIFGLVSMGKPSVTPIRRITDTCPHIRIPEPVLGKNT